MWKKFFYFVFHSVCITFALDFGVIVRIRVRLVKGNPV
jgi:hypothetical protein